MTSPFPRILCIGDIDIDLMVAVPALPAHDGKVGGRRIGRFPGGMAANVAVALTRLGCPVRMLGAVGEDTEGGEALAALKDAGVDTSACVVRSGTATFTCIVLLVPEGEKALVRLDTPAFMPRKEDLTDVAFRGMDHVHINYGDAELAAAGIAWAEAFGASVSLDLEAADIPEGDTSVLEELLSRVDILFTNAAVAERLPRLKRGRDGLGAVVTTRGRAGSYYRDGDGEATAEGHAVSVVDTTGAGDCFAAAFLWQRLQGASPEESLAAANAGAALSTRAYGAQTAAPTAAQIERFRAAIEAAQGGEAACRIATEGSHE